MWEHAAAVFEVPLVVAADEWIYDNIVDALFVVICETVVDVGTLAFVGYNPFMVVLVHEFDDRIGDVGVCVELVHGFLMLGVVVFVVDLGWFDVDVGLGMLIYFSVLWG